MEDHTTTKLNNGPAAAALLAAGIGCAALGLITILGESMMTLKPALTWWSPTGSLSGKTGISVLIWLSSWLVFHWKWRNIEVERFSLVVRMALFGIAIGWLGTFPPIFELFAGH